MTFATIPDRVPVAAIRALTNAALRVYLERHGWRLYDEWTHAKGDTFVTASGYDDFADHALRMSQAIGDIVTADNLRSADVIAELQAIAEWQRRCAEWVEPADTCNHCWACECKLASPWEAPGSFMPNCPTCDNKQCPRATDHRNVCSGSNEPGQVGSRYQ